MSAQTESIRKKDDTTSQPPVIIKSGGGGGGPNSIKVSFDGNGNVFDSPRQPRDWQFSRLSRPASIKSLEIEDGSITLPTIDTDSSSEPAVLQVSWGQGTLMVNDMPLRDSDNTEIAIASPVRFKITEPRPGPDQWINSEAEFPDTAPFVLFTQGGRELRGYQCTSVNVTLILHFK